MSGASDARGGEGRPESFRRLFRGQVTLGLREELVADHELSLRGTQQGREEMGVQLPVWLLPPAERCLVPPHRIREWHAEQPVVRTEQLDQDRRQRVTPAAVKVRQ